jgi:hypothetical protein
MPPYDVVYLYVVLFDLGMARASNLMNVGLHRNLVGSVLVGALIHYCYFLWCCL